MSYSAARTQVLQGCDEISAIGFSGSTPHFSVPCLAVPNKFRDDLVAEPGALDVVILKTNLQSARMQVLATGEQITLRSSKACMYVPGQTVTVNIAKRWVHRGYAYGSGEVGNGRIDVAALGLTPHALEDQGLENWGDDDELDVPPPIRALWRRIAAKPRPSFVMERIVPGLDDASDDEHPVYDALEVYESGAVAEAEEILMGLLQQDLRCLDAHAFLGNFAFDRSLDVARLHYEIGLHIGMQALGTDFTGMLSWGWLANRPFLRCLHGYGLVLWRLGRMKEAEHVFERMVWLNPNDNQGARFCWLDVKTGKTWEEANRQEHE